MARACAVNTGVLCFTQTMGAYTVSVVGEHVSMQPFSHGSDSAGIDWVMLKGGLERHR